MATSAYKLRRRLEMVPALWGRGPVSYDYGRRVDGTAQLLATLYDKESPQARGFLELVGEGAEARGWGLPLTPDHPWGIQARPHRAEQFLTDLLDSLGTTGRTLDGTHRPASPPPQPP